MTTVVKYFGTILKIIGNNKIDNYLVKSWILYIVWWES